MRFGQLREATARFSSFLWAIDVEFVVAAVAEEILPSGLTFIVIGFAAPASAQYSLYYGNFHAHCNLSADATGPDSGPPDETESMSRS